MLDRLRPPDDLKQDCGWRGRLQKKKLLALAVIVPLGRAGAAGDLVAAFEFERGMVNVEPLSELLFDGFLNRGPAVQIECFHDHVRFESPIVFAEFPQMQMVDISDAVDRLQTLDNLPGIDCGRRAFHQDVNGTFQVRKTLPEDVRGNDERDD